MGMLCEESSVIDKRRILPQMKYEPFGDDKPSAVNSIEGLSVGQDPMHDPYVPIVKQDSTKTSSSTSLRQKLDMTMLKVAFEPEEPSEDKSMSHFQVFSPTRLSQIS